MISLVPRPLLFSFFGLSSVEYTEAEVYYTECKPKNENGGGLGMRLSDNCYKD